MDVTPLGRLNVEFIDPPAEHPECADPPTEQDVFPEATDVPTEGEENAGFIDPPADHVPAVGADTEIGVGEAVERLHVQPQFGAEITVEAPLLVQWLRSDENRQMRLY